MTATGTASATGATGPSATGSTQQGGVLGATASAGNSAPQGGVLGAVAAVGQGVLPFTGFPLWVAVAAAAGLIALGLTLRRRVGVTV